MHLKMFLLSLTLANLHTLANGLPTLDTSLKLNSLQCLSEGRYSDPLDCGLFYDCVPNDNGVLVALHKSCFGHAFDPTLKACVPTQTVQGCFPYATRSLNVAEPKLQQICTNKTNEFVCSDCKTLVICVDGVPYTDPCGTGTVCSRQSNFGDAVCYPDNSIDCTCKKEDIFKQDHYNPTKFLSCGPEGNDFTIHTCPDGLVFNEKHGTCCTENESSCTASGVYEVKDDCNRYYTKVLTTGGWFQNEFTCKNKTMFNEDTGKCEDPCTWYSGSFICEAEGRFANPSNCSKYFECISDQVNSDRFTYKEHDCPIEYEWNQSVKSGFGHCVTKDTVEEKCVPLKPKPYNCHIPNECKVDCGKVQPPVNGFLNETGTFFGDSIMYSCEAGYELDGANEAKCLATGKWSQEAPQCKIKDCGLSDAPVNGVVNQEIGTLIGDSITFRCEAGYDLDGANETKCLATGKWSHEVPQCKIKDCGLADAPVNGFVNQESGTLFGDSIIFRCEAGYDLDGADEAKCLSTGKWSQDVPPCKIKNCGLVDTPVNGIVNQDTGTLFGDSITFGCDDGYNLDGANVVTCLLTGKWSQEVPQCIIKDCGLLDAPVNGFVNQETGTLFGDRITFRCEAGYDLDGANEAKCLATGTWSHEVPECKIGCEALGAVMIGGQCLYFSPESDGRKTWDDAVVACTNKRGALAGPIEDPQAVVDYVKKIGNWYGHVGATDVAEEGTWRWLNGQLLGSNIPWYGSEPNDGSRQNCLYVDIRGYHDNNCAHQQRYICDLGTVTKLNIRSEVKAPAADNKISNTDIPECVSPWIYAGHNTGCLLVTQQSMDWHSAQAYCNSMGGHLPMLDRESKRIDMIDYYQRSGLENVSFWLGANDNSGSLLWVNGMPVRDGWKYTQSKVDQGEDMCLYTYLSGQNGDPPLINYCSHLLHNIICQKKVM